MSLCKENTTIKVEGCKIEDPTANPPILLTNFQPDINGVTHHNPLFCQEKKPPIDEGLEEPSRIASFKNRKVVLNNISNGNIEDGFRKISSFLWNVRNTINGDELYHVWTQANSDDKLLDNRKLYNVIITDDQINKNSNLFGSRKASVGVIGQLIQGSQTLSNGSITTSFAPLGVNVDPLTGFESFESFRNKMREEIKTGVNYQDIVFSTMIPFDQEDVEELTVLDSNRYKSVWNFNYNFYAGLYEAFAANEDIPEQILPNLQVWFSELLNRQGESFVRELSVQRFFDFINLNGAIFTEQKKANLVFPKLFSNIRVNNRSFDVTSTEEYRYFEEWSRRYNFLLPESFEKISKYFLTTMASSTDLDLIDRINQRNNFFPMNVYTSFPTQNAVFRGSSFAIQRPFLEALTEATLDDSLLIYIIRNTPQLGLMPTVVESSLEQQQQGEINDEIKNLVGEEIEKTFILDRRRSNFDRLSYTSDFKEQNYTSLKKERGSLATSKIKTETNERRVWDVSKWIELFNSFEFGSETLEKNNALQIFETKELDVASFLGSHPLTLRNYNPQSFQFFKNLMLLVFSSKIKNMLKCTADGGLFRTVHDMFSFGRECHSEQLFFRICKKRASDNVILQNFYFPNSTKKDILEWYDSQVKYGEEYSYEVYSYNLVLSTEYNYSNLNIISNKNVTIPGQSNASGINDNGPVAQFSPGAPVAVFDIEYHPTFVLVEEPYFEFTGRVLDSPPVPPEFDFVPFVNVDDRIQINLRSNTGQIVAKPISLSIEEEEYYNQISDRDGNVLFKNDDPITSFEVYRLESVPLRIEDFENNSFVVNSKNNAPAASFMENISTNIKYYYMFRSIDRHGHKSYPSPIYEVELVDDGGFIYLETKIIDINDISDKFLTKDFVKYLKIEPSILQTSIDLENSFGFKGADGQIAQSATDVYPKIGLQNETVFDKNYKIRITSKKSGKKIDINFKINHKHDSEL